MPQKPTLTAFRKSPSSIGLSGLLQEIGTVVHGMDRRAEARVPKSILLHVQPLDSNFDPNGQPFKAVTRDFSDAGLGFLHKHEFESEYVQIGPNEHSQSQSIARVCYNVAYGGGADLYLIGVAFLK
jgi:hypothetical protein